MTAQRRRLRLPAATALIWVGGVGALLGMVIYSRATASPYPTNWPWITFACMAILELAVLNRSDAPSSPVVRVVLLAAVIMFRKHPDVVAIVTLAGALGGGILARLPWRTTLAITAWFLMLAAAGTACLRLVGYEDTAHFVVATGALILVYVAVTFAIDRRRTRPLLGLALGLIGALLALAWRTPATGPVMLRLGEVAILAVIGVVIGFALGGRPQYMLERRLHLRGIPVLALAGGLALLVSTRASGQASTLLAVAGVGMIGVYAVQSRLFPIACVVLGALANEVARLANDGRMPVDTISLPPNVVDELGDLSQTPIYRATSPSTHLAWLADRFPLTPFPGVASLGDALIALGIVWLFASLTMPRDAQVAAESAAGDVAA